MNPRRRRTLFVAVLSFIVASISVTGNGQEPRTIGPAVKRPVTVADAIGMTRVGNSALGSSSWQEGSPALSPDGSRIAVVLRKGDLEHNINTYSLFVVERDTVFRNPVKKLLVSFSSSSSREGIKQVKWIADNETILFLGENPGELTQLYSIRYPTGKLKRLTSHATSVTTYSVSASGKQIVFAAEKPTPNLLSEEVRRHGFHVPANSLLPELAAGRVLEGSADQCELFGQKGQLGKDSALTITGRLLFPQPPLFVSPDGKYLVAMTFVRKIHPAWRGYNSPFVKKMMDTNQPNGSLTWIASYELVALEDGSARPLINAPIGSSHSELMWSPDSQSVVVTGVHLPLEVSNQQEREARRSATFIAEVRVSDGGIEEITNRDLKLVGWDRQSNLWKFEERQAQGKGDNAPQVEYYRKTSAGWESVTNLPQAASRTEPQVFVEEDLNVPPRIIAEEPRTKQRVVLFDLNPQFSDLALGKVEDIRWVDPSGHEIRAGLYLPPDYAPGRRYPLVIQTHGYHAHEFWIDGPYTTAFAAQPLAGKGIVVLQLPQLAVGTGEEGERNTHAMESAIDYLDQKGIIDRTRVGLIGFSRTCYHVKYALTHSKVHFAAASVTEGVDAGYLQYMMYANASPPYAADAETLNGGAAPFGQGLSVWLEHSPGFLLNRVETPLEIQANALGSLLGEWEWFSGLSRLGKPVDFVYLPQGTHILEKPWERIVSQQTNVDWFVFWLKGEEDPDPTKFEQYARWRELRKKHEENMKKLSEE